VINDGGGLGGLGTVRGPIDLKVAGVIAPGQFGQYSQDTLKAHRDLGGQEVKSPRELAKQRVIIGT